MNNGRIRRSVRQGYLSNYKYPSTKPNPETRPLQLRYPPIKREILWEDGYRVQQRMPIQRASRLRQRYPPTELEEEISWEETYSPMQPVRRASLSQHPYPIEETEEIYSSSEDIMPISSIFLIVLGIIVLLMLFAIIDSLAQSNIAAVVIITTSAIPSLWYLISIYEFFEKRKKRH